MLWQIATQSEQSWGPHGQARGWGGQEGGRRRGARFRKLQNGVCEDTAQARGVP